WMQPLYEFRRWLKIIREDEGLRNKYKRNGQPGLGPFTSDARLMILERLLKTEQEVGLRLIGDDELLYIQQIWTGEFDVMDSALRLAHQYHRMPNQSIAI
ncbi:MAG: DNA phosphorothioation system sulfurtransferase DndC, partial [Desulfobulbaceae bacterium]|nr:DNA phosphorothioation system sulfurtransferase DndC [Desulfobulbaceae bacterium]